ncbi:MAG: hypothetical protein GY754_29230 [bacterium]|nr:hypothetical protein [bacterium]
MNKSLKKETKKSLTVNPGFIAKSGVIITLFFFLAAQLLMAAKPESPYQKKIMEITRELNSTPVAGVPFEKELSNSRFLHADSIAAKIYFESFVLTYKYLDYLRDLQDAHSSFSAIKQSYLDYKQKELETRKKFANNPKKINGKLELLKQENQGIIQAYNNQGKKLKSHEFALSGIMNIHHFSKIDSNQPYDIDDINKIFSLLYKGTSGEAGHFRETMGALIFNIPYYLVIKNTVNEYAQQYNRAMPVDLYASILLMMFLQETGEKTPESPEFCRKWVLETIVPDKAVRTKLLALPIKPVVIKHQETIAPNTGVLTTMFNIHNPRKRIHKGIDIAGSYNTPIKSMISGELSFLVRPPSSPSGNIYRMYDPLSDMEFQILHIDDYNKYKGSRGSIAKEKLLNNLINLETKNTYIVDKSENIGFIGNKGRSSGPHVHFSAWQIIRDSSNRIQDRILLNPMPFNGKDRQKKFIRFANRYWPTISTYEIFYLSLVKHFINSYSANSFFNTFSPGSEEFFQELTSSYSPLLPVINTEDITGKELPAPVLNEFPFEIRKQAAAEKIKKFRQFIAFDEAQKENAGNQYPFPVTVPMELAFPWFIFPVRKEDEEADSYVNRISNSILLNLYYWGMLDPLANLAAPGTRYKPPEPYSTDKNKISAIEVKNDVHNAIFSFLLSNSTPGEENQDILLNEPMEQGDFFNSLQKHIGKNFIVGAPKSAEKSINFIEDTIYPCFVKAVRKADLSTGSSLEKMLDFPLHNEDQLMASLSETKSIRLDSISLLPYIPSFRNIFGNYIIRHIEILTEFGNKKELEKLTAAWLNPDGIQNYYDHHFTAAFSTPLPAFNILGNPYLVKQNLLKNQLLYEIFYTLRKDALGYFPPELFDEFLEHTGSFDTSLKIFYEHGITIDLYKERIVSIKKEISSVQTKKKQAEFAIENEKNKVEELYETVAHQRIEIKKIETMRDSEKIKKDEARKILNVLKKEQEDKKEELRTASNKLYGLYQVNAELAKKEGRLIQENRELARQVKEVNENNKKLFAEKEALLETIKNRENDFGTEKEQLLESINQLKDRVRRIISSYRHILKTESFKFNKMERELKKKHQLHIKKLIADHEKLIDLRNKDHEKDVGGLDGKISLFQDIIVNISSILNGNSFFQELKDIKSKEPRAINKELIVRINTFVDSHKQIEKELQEYVDLTEDYIDSMSSLFPHASLDRSKEKPGKINHIYDRLLHITEEIVSVLKNKGTLKSDIDQLLRGNNKFRERINLLEKEKSTLEQINFKFNKESQRYLPENRNLKKDIELNNMLNKQLRHDIAKLRQEKDTEIAGLADSWNKTVKKQSIAYDKQILELQRENRKMTQDLKILMKSIDESEHNKHEEKALNADLPVVDRNNNREKNPKRGFFNIFRG